MIFRAAILLALSAPSFAQAGGGSDLIFQWDGVTNYAGVGSSVSNAGDVNADGFDDVIVGAPKNGGFSIGTASVYSGLDGSILFEWTGPNTASNFGASVSGGGDINGDGFDDLIVGAPQANPNGNTWSGSAFAYSGADGSLLFQWDGAAPYDNYGISVSMAGDVNQDGVPDVVVGAPRADTSSIADAGTAYVYSGLNGSLLYQWSGLARDDAFAGAVSGAGDVNQDGYEDIIIGAKNTVPSGWNAIGSVYVFSGANGSLLYEWAGDWRLDWFGASVSSAGDLNQDGFADLLVGAPLTNQGAISDFGTVYAYSGSDGSRLFQWEGEEAGDSFGWAVSCSGDTNGDGYPDLLVGAPFAGTGTLYSAGAAYLYSGKDGNRLHKWTGNARSDFFGSSVSVTGNGLGNERPNLVIGARNTGVDSQGSAYVYTFNPFLQSDAITISASSGGTIQLDLDFPDAAALDEYKVLLSATGLGPSIYGVDIPLSRDNLVNHTFLGNYPMPASNMHGVLDASGNASASFTAPAGFNPQLIGRTFHLAAIANQPGQLPEYSSVAVAIEITP